MNKPCEQCGNNFSPWASEILARFAVFCAAPRAEYSADREQYLRNVIDEIIHRADDALAGIDRDRYQPTW